MKANEAQPVPSVWPRLVAARRGSLRTLACLLALAPAPAFAPIEPALPPDDIRDIVVTAGEATLQFDSGHVVTFRLAAGAVVQIDLRVRGVDHSVSLECAGGLRDVHFATAQLRSFGPEYEDNAFALLFDMGSEASRSFGSLPRVQLSFYRGRVTEMLVSNRTGPTGTFGSKLCSSLPIGPITCKDTRRLQGLDPETLVQQLRDVPPIWPATVPVNPAAERQRRRVYEELLDWGPASVPPLVRALGDSDPAFRRNAVLAFMALGGGWPFECGPAKLDISAALPALMTALADSDQSVRGWAAQAIGSMGEKGADAVPSLIAMLADGYEGSRNSACIALRGIGPPAQSALPALRRALSDASEDVRRFAAGAIRSIEG